MVPKSNELLSFFCLNISPLTILFGPIKTLFSRFLGELLHGLLGFAEVKVFFFKWGIMKNFHIGIGMSVRENGIPCWLSCIVWLRG